MRIALVSHARHPIRPPFAGGLEAHNWHLAHALRARGHAVTLFASGDSDPDFPIVPVVRQHVEATHPGREHADDAALKAHVDAAYDAACARIGAGDFDIVHNHSLHRFLPMAARERGWRMVTSLHTPPVGGLEWFIGEALSPRHRVSAASAHQLRLWWPERVSPFASVVANGIAIESWPFSAEGDGSAAWSGRILPEKAPHLALDAARLAGIALRLAGPIEDRAYFEAEIAPRLRNGATYLGALDRASLAGMLGRASVFLSTPCWPEAFGLAAIEAMSCGLPVAAFDSGAVREVIGEDSGRYAPAGDTDALAVAIKAALPLSRRAARRRVEERFSTGAMLEGYEALYRCVLGE
ncbi:glycosyltransferase [Acetobacteraceae bacterium KSS8]|uniref:Glycosyltransferase n=1 Tax=Endosaccharibacter trunci TaxID=2812733 RepID=A0ABT1WBF6_9PROT|nr:glycosyltransferase [Acetobacteraceae bacterium KSS8]